MVTCREVLGEVEWAMPIYGVAVACPKCGRSITEGHASDCALDASLKSKTVEVEIKKPFPHMGCWGCKIYAICEFRRQDKPDANRFIPGPGCPWYQEGGEHAEA